MLNWIFNQNYTMRDRLHSGHFREQRIQDIKASWPAVIFGSSWSSYLDSFFFFVANQKFVRTFFISKSTANGRTAELGAIIMATCTALVSASTTDRKCDCRAMETLYRWDMCSKFFQCTSWIEKSDFLLYYSPD